MIHWIYHVEFFHLLWYSWDIVTIYHERIYYEWKNNIVGKSIKWKPFDGWITRNGLLLPALVLSDINVDSAKLLQNKNQVDVNGFIVYTDIVFLRMSENNKNIMLHITNYDSKLPPKEIRRLFIQDTLETFINTREIPADEIVQSLVSKYQQ